ncbi:MAG: metallophosphoesterase [Phycisphaerales bacterium]|nr:metallophosphoesterase [Phycisphaerales bacterium]
MTHRIRVFLIVILFAVVAPACHTAQPAPRQPLELAAAPAVDMPSIVAGTPGRALPPPVPVRPNLRLAILPDRTTGRDWGMPYLQRAIDDLGRTRPDAVCCIGDLVQGYTRNPDRYESEADAFLSIINQLDLPFYPVPGNHDVISGSRVAGDATFESSYQRRFGPLYYAVDFGLATMIVLDSDELLDSSADPIFSARQLAWLDEALARAVAVDRPTLILIHRPAWRYRESNYLSDVHPRLVAAGVYAVFAGHFHSLQQDPDRDGIRYSVLGTCGGMIDQHPLAGQLQHVTYITITDTGDVTVYHSPVGHTLPADWMLARDQDRAFRLKSRGFGQLSSLPQPIDVETAGATTITIRNPIDVPITIDASLVTDVPGPQIVSGEHFVSRTERDIFSDANTYVETSFRMTAGVDPITLAPGESADLTIELASPPQGRMTPPPEIHLKVTFVDSQGRAVPVTIRRRLPLTMAVDASQGETGPLLVWAWRASVYDTDEPGATFTLDRRDDELHIALRVPDDIVCGPVDAAADDSAHLHRPTGDAVTLTIDSRRYLIEPFAPQGRRVFEAVSSDDALTLSATDRITIAAQRTPEGYGMRIVIRDVPSQVRFDLRVADNDEGFFTQWRQFAPPWLTPAGVIVR